MPIPAVRIIKPTLERNFGITPRWVDDQAYDTFQNAQNAARLLRADGIARVLLVSHSTHLWRAAHEFMAAGIQVVPGPVDQRSQPPPGWLSWLPDPQALVRSHIAIYELLGEQVRELFSVAHLRRQ